jgi:uncharacterized protein YdbL (DUF1318 family)
LAGSAVAQDIAAAKQRMASRQSEVASLKTSGAVGENNRGLLEVRRSGGASAKIVADENSDRGVLYAEVAKRTGVSVDDSGRARAKQIAANSAAGVWIQKEDGSWHQK